MKFSDIPQFTRDGHYRINVPWDYLEDWISRERGELSLNLEPDFQRAHVWSEEKQRAYVEFQLRGGVGSKELRFNCAGWQRDYRGPFVIVDGKQRLEAVRKFLRNDLEIFDGHRYKDFEDSLRINCNDFIISINDLETRREVLQWYLDLNSGGVVHTEDELNRVRELLRKEQN